MKPFDEDDIARRLRSLGEKPVEPGVAARHVSYLAAAAPIVEHRRRRPAITAAFVAGALLGGTGLAAALPGPLPTQASSVARSALEAVNLAEDEPKDPAKAAAKAQRAQDRAAAKAAGAAKGQGVARFTEGCTVGDPAVPFTGNHGQYVKAHPDDPDTADNEREEAALSDCGKPAKAVANKARPAGNDDDKGKPEDAGKPAETGKPAAAGRPENAGRSTSSPRSSVAENGKSDGEEPGNGKPGGAGKSDQKRPKGVGPSTSTP